MGSGDGDAEEEACGSWKGTLVGRVVVSDAAPASPGASVWPGEANVSNPEEPFAKVDVLAVRITRRQIRVPENIGSKSAVAGAGMFAAGDGADGRIMLDLSLSLS